MSRVRILLADNLSDYRASLVPLLRLEGYEVEEADSVDSAVHKLETVPVDLALVDLRLTNERDDNDISGLEVAKRAGEHNVLCIVVTAWDSAETARLALRSRGADPSLAYDYVAKRYGPHAVLAAIADVLRQRRENAVPSDLVVDAQRGAAWLHGNPVKLSRLQFALLTHACEKKGSVCTRKELVKAIYDEDVSETEANTDKRLERLIRRLREKIEEDPNNPKRLVSVQGLGIRLESGE